jgi:hypothetical protein
LLTYIIAVKQGAANLYFLPRRLSIPTVLPDTGQDHYVLAFLETL